ncbi:hypothetical protein MT418_001761 [Batrachochytrium dendrobatidis]
MYRGDRKGLAVSAIGDDQYHDVGTDKYLLEETGLKFEDDESNSPDEQLSNQVHIKNEDGFDTAAHTEFSVKGLYSHNNAANTIEIDVSDDDPDDPIIQVMPVYMSNELTESLYLMQFPTRPIPFTRDVQPTAGRIKYNTNRVQLDIALDKESAHYDWNTGERFGQGLDNKPIATAYDLANRDDRQDSGTMLDHIKMDSKMVPLNAQYMVGVVQDGAIHLKPLSTVLQLRQSLDYIDKLHDKEKSANQRVLYEERKEISGVEEEAKVVQMMARTLEDKDAARRASLAEIQRNLDNEAWTTLSIYDVEHEDSLYYRGLLSETKEQPIEFVSTSQTYLNTISPLLASDFKNDVLLSRQQRPDAKKNLARPGMSAREMEHLPLLEKIKALLINAHVIQFSSLYQMIGKNTTEQDFILALEQVAVLIRGVWVVKSELLYIGRPYDARRFMLMLFADNEYVLRKVFVDATHLMPNMAKGMLNEIADLDAGLGWRLKVKSDDNFVARYPDIVVRQMDIVRSEGQKSVEAMRPPERMRRRQSQQVNREAMQAIPSSVAAVSKQAASSTSLGLIGPEGDLSEAHIEILVKALFLESPVCTFKYITKYILDNSKSKLNDTLTQTIQCVVNKLCIMINDVYLLKMTQNPAIDQFRPAILSLFQEKAEVKKVEIIARCKEMAGKAPSAAHYSKIMTSFAHAVSGSWVLNPSPL